VAEFQTVGNSILSLSSIVGGSTRFIETMSTSGHRAFTVVFTTSFAVAALFIYAAVLATIINTYTTVRRTVYHYSPTDARDDELISFLTKQLKKWLGITRPKPVYCSRDQNARESVNVLICTIMLLYCYLPHSSKVLFLAMSVTLFVCFVCLSLKYPGNR